MAFITIREYAKKVKRTKQMISLILCGKTKSGSFAKDDYIYFEKLGAYLINENAKWPLIAGRPRKVKEVEATK